jgi:hypothetical protein
MKLYRYGWGNNPTRALYKDSVCIVLAEGKKNSVLVQFEDGFQMITSRNALKEIT